MGLDYQPGTQTVEVGSSEQSSGLGGDKRGDQRNTDNDSVAFMDWGNKKDKLNLTGTLSL